MLMIAALKYTERLDYVKLVQNMHRLPLKEHQMATNRGIAPGREPLKSSAVPAESGSGMLSKDCPRELGTRIRRPRIMLSSMW